MPTPPLLPSRGTHLPSHLVSASVDGAGSAGAAAPSHHYVLVTEPGCVEELALHGTPRKGEVLLQLGCPQIPELKRVVGHPGTSEHAVTLGREGVRLRYGALPLPRGTQEHSYPTWGKVTSSVGSGIGGQVTLIPELLVQGQCRSSKKSQHRPALARTLHAHTV